jgi:serine O-acetyltransferase
MNTTPAGCVARGHDKFVTFRRSFEEDIQRYLNKSPENQAAGDNLKSRIGALLTPNLQALLIYRASHYLNANGWGRCARLLSRLNLLLDKVNLPPQSCIGPGCFLPHPAGVTFCGIAGRGLTLYSLAVCCPAEGSLAQVQFGPRLGDSVTVGAHAVLLGPITVGNDARVAFSVRVDRDIPAGVLVVSKALRVTMHGRSGER